MKLVSAQMAVGVAVLAAVVGARMIGVEELQNHWRPIVAVAVAAFVVYLLMKIFEYMQYCEAHLQWIGEKTTYIEQRIDKAAGRTGDICRHLQQTFQEFDLKKNEAKTTEAKWWWVERRPRSIFEDFANCRAMEKSSFQAVQNSWSMLQTLGLS